MDVLLLSLTHFEKFDQTCIDLVRALHHALDVDHVVALPITKFIVTTCVLKVRRLSYDHLAHFIYEQTLTAV